VDSSSPPIGRDSEGYYYHTGAIAFHTNEEMNVTYHNMTSSYTNKAVYVNSFEEIISKPTFSAIKANVAYRIRDTSGLSLCL
jgi:hypothetical protein